MLTMKSFKDYRKNVRALDRIRNEGTSVADTVRGSSPEPPYGLHTLTIKGSSGKRHAAQKHLEAACAEVETAIALAPETMRKLLEYKYVYGLTWVQVGERLGMQQDAARMAVKRYIEKAQP